MRENEGVFRFLAQQVHGSSVKRLSESASWFDTLLETPRIRFNGLYISKMYISKIANHFHSHYYRTGYSDDWNQPLHMVTYFRYMRLFPAQKRVLFVTTSLEPSSWVIQHMDFYKISNIASKCSSIMTGLYSTSESRVEANLIDEKRPSMTFTMAFSIGRTRRKLNWKLDWEEYYITNRGERCDIPKDGLVQFFFSRVNSFPCV